MNQSWENGKKPNFGQVFVGFVSTNVKHSCKLSLYVNSRKTNEPNLRKSQKN